MNALTLASVLFSTFTKMMRVHPSTSIVIRPTMLVSPHFVVPFVTVAVEHPSHAVVDEDVSDAAVIVPAEVDVVDNLIRVSKENAIVVGWPTTIPIPAAS